MITAKEAKKNCDFFDNIDREIKNIYREIENRSIMGIHEYSIYCSMECFNDDYMKALKVHFDTLGYKVNILKDFNPKYYQLVIKW